MEKGHEICYVDVKSLHVSGSLTTVTREFARYIFDNAGVQEDIMDKGSTPRAGEDIVFYGEGNHQLGTGFILHHRIV
jgi:hypothetical protein